MAAHIHDSSELQATGVSGHHETVVRRWGIKSVTMEVQVTHQKILLTINLPIDVVESFSSQPSSCKQT